MYFTICRRPKVLWKVMCKFRFYSPLPSLSGAAHYGRVRVSHTRGIVTDNHSLMVSCHIPNLSGIKPNAQQAEPAEHRPQTLLDNQPYDHLAASHSPA